MRVSPGLASRGGPAPASRWLRRIALLVLAMWAVVALVARIPGGPFEPPAPNSAEGRAQRSSLALLPPMTHGAFVEVAPGPVEGRPRIEFVRSDEVPEDGEVLQWRRYWLGTDRIGNDLARLLAHGAGVSLLIGLAAALLAVTIGIGVGAIAGLGGPWVDGLLMRTVDALLAFPLLLLVLMLDLLFDPGPTALVLLLGGTQWTGVARVTRAEMLRLRSEPFVLAARGVGARGTTLFRRHLLGNALSPILVVGLLLVGDSILLESAISFLGFGAAADLVSWGRLVDAGRSHLFDAWWISTLPGAAIVLVVTSCNLLGERWTRTADAPGSSPC